MKLGLSEQGPSLVIRLSKIKKARAIFMARALIVVLLTISWR